MSKTTLFATTLMVLLGFSSLVSAKHNTFLNVFQQQKDWSPDGINQTEFRYYYTMARGYLDGTQKGLYNDNSLKLKPDCMGEQSYKDIIKLENLLSAGDIGGLFKSSGSIFALAYTFDKTCDLNELFFQLGQYAINNGTTPEQISLNLQNNMFSLIGNVNQILEVFFGNENKAIDWLDLDACFTKYQTLGQQIGKLLRVIFNFNGSYPSS